VLILCLFAQSAREECIELRQEASDLQEYSNAKIERVTRYLGVLAEKARRLGGYFLPSFCTFFTRHFWNFYVYWDFISIVYLWYAVFGVWIGPAISEHVREERFVYHIVRLQMKVFWRLDYKLKMEAGSCCLKVVWYMTIYNTSLYFIICIGVTTSSHIYSLSLTRWCYFFRRWGSFGFRVPSDSIEERKEEAF
jgi:hypothetical protein